MTRPLSSAPATIATDVRLSAPSSAPTSQVAAGALALATAVDFGALAWLGMHPGPADLWMAAALHLVAAAIVIVCGGGPRSERALAAALTLTLPLAGPPIAAMMLGTDRRGEIAEAERAAAPASPRISPGDLHRMAEGLSCCEALLVADADDRRAIVSALSRHPDRDAVALLRWALASRHPDLAVEAALALEDIGATFDADLAAGRAALEQTPTFEAALAVADAITDAIEAGVADAPLVPALSREARQSYARAAELDPTRFDVTAVGRARMELATLHPDAALEAIDRALPTACAATRDDLTALRQEAVLASHSLPWEGPSALATYGRPLAHGGTARRHTLVPLLGTEVTRG